MTSTVCLHVHVLNITFNRGCLKRDFKIIKRKIIVLNFLFALSYVLHDDL